MFPLTTPAARSERVRCLRNLVWLVRLVWLVWRPVRRVLLAGVLVAGVLVMQRRKVAVLWVLWLVWRPSVVVFLAAALAIASVLAVIVLLMLRAPALVVMGASLRAPRVISM